MNHAHTKKKLFEAATNISPPLLAGSLPDTFKRRNRIMCFQRLPAGSCPRSPPKWSAFQSPAVAEGKTHRQPGHVDLTSWSWSYFSWILTFMLLKLILFYLDFKFIFDSTKFSIRSEKSSTSVHTGVGRWNNKPSSKTMDHKHWTNSRLLLSRTRSNMTGKWSITSWEDDVKF